MKRTLFANVILFFVFLAYCLPVQAQKSNSSDFSLKSPYNTVYSHLYHLNDDYRPDISRQVFHDIKNAKKAEKLAIQLKQVLDGKGLKVIINQIPQNPNFKDSLSQANIYTLFPIELPEVYLEKIGANWYYSESTIKAIPKLHQQVYPLGSDLLIGLLSGFGNNKFLGLAAWQYVGILILLLIAWIIHFLFSWILRFLIRVIMRNQRISKNLNKKLVGKIARMLSLVVVLWLLIRFYPILQFNINLAESINLVLRIVQSVFVGILFLRLVDMAMLYVSILTQRTASKMDDQLVPILRRALDFIVIIIVIIHILTLLKINVTALLAGISIGGLALALAAQDTVKNLLGSVMIFIDKPFQIGDYVSVDGTAGTVVEVGMRSTRIETAGTSIVAIPNGKLADMTIENLGVRVFRRFNTTLSLTYNTSPTAIELFIKGVHGVINTHPNTKKDNPIVRFINMGASSLDIFVNLYLIVDSYDQELKVKEDLLLAILHLADTLNIGLAFPSTSVYLESIPTQLADDSSTEELQKKMNDFLLELKSKNSTDNS